MIVGAAILLVGIVLGWFIGRFGRMHRAMKPRRPVCGCTHHLSFHGGGGECSHQASAYTGVCGCMKYIQENESAGAAAAMELGW